MSGSAASARHDAARAVRKAAIDALAAAQVPNFVYATIVTVNNSAGTVSIRQKGSPTVTPNVKFLSSYSPLPGDTVLCADVGSDLFVIDTFAPAALPLDFVQRNAAYTPVSGGPTILPFDTRVATEEATSDFSTTTHQFTCPTPGIYTVKSVLVFGLPTSTTISHACFKNGSQWALLDYFTSAGGAGNFAISGGCDVPCAVGDVLDIRYSNSSGSTTLFTGGDAWASFAFQNPL